MGATKTWREAAREEIRRRGRGAHAAAARAIGCSPPTLTLLLDGRIAVSPLVPLLSEHLGIPKPGEVLRSPDEIEFAAKYATLNASDRQLAHAFLDRLASSNPKNDQ